MPVIIIATKKQIARAIRSFVVVIKGPEARAGLNFNLFKIIGVIVPKIDETKTIENRDIETI